MTDDNHKRLKGKEVSSSSPDYFRQDRREELKREVEKGTKQGKLESLRKQVDAQQKLQEQVKMSRPAKERATNVMEAAEHAGSAKEFVEKEQLREEAREEAQKQGAPEGTSEEQG